MNKLIVSAVLLGLLVGAFVYLKSKGPQVGAGGTGVSSFYYTSATASTSSVATTWSTSPVLAANSARGYVSFCNESVTSGQAIYLGMGATTTGVSGIKIAANSCYEMTQEKMFYGDIYAIASSTPNMLLILKAVY